MCRWRRWRVGSVENLWCYDRSDQRECMSFDSLHKLFCRVCLRWSKEQSRQCCNAMHNTQVVLTSMSVVWNDGHVRVADVTSVKSSKVGTMLFHDCHANLHVIVVQSPVPIGKHVSEQQVVEQICDARNGPPRTQWSCRWWRLQQKWPPGDETDLQCKEECRILGGQDWTMILWHCDWWVRPGSMCEGWNECICCFRSFVLMLRGKYILYNETGQFGVLGCLWKCIP